MSWTASGAAKRRVARGHGCGDLKAVEQRSGAGPVDAAGAQRGEDAGDGELDGARVFERVDFDFGFFTGFGRLHGEVVKTGMKVAIWLAAQGR
jgi:hypothetical protein